MKAEIRPMHAEEADEADAVFWAALTPLMSSGGERSDEEVAAARRRFAHFLATDPGGSFVAVEQGRIVGIAQAHVRERIFVLASLGVVPDAQEHRIGRALLEAALDYGVGSRVQYIFSSMDPRALHRYVRAGFVLHPAVTISGRPGPSPSGPDELRLSEGSPADVALVTEIDRAVRGGGREVDVRFWLEGGQRLVISEGNGYAVLSNGRLQALGATSRLVASRLLRAVLSGYLEAPPVDVSWVTADQQWAIETAAACAATLRIQGAIMTRNLGRLPIPYLPGGLFG